MPFNLKSFLGAGIDKAASAIGKAFDDNFTNREELAKAGIDLEKVKASVIAEANRHFEELGRQALEMEKAYLADVANARALQVAALAQNDLFSKRFIYYLAGFIVISATAAGFGLYWIKVPEENKRMVEMFFDVYLFAGALSVIYFFFGSSRGQERNEETKAITEAAKPAKES